MDKLSKLFKTKEYLTGIVTDPNKVRRFNTKLKPHYANTPNVVTEADRYSIDSVEPEWEGEVDNRDSIDDAPNDYEKELGRPSWMEDEELYKDWNYSADKGGKRRKTKRRKTKTRKTKRRKTKRRKTKTRKTKRRKTKRIYH